METLCWSCVTEECEWVSKLEPVVGGLYTVKKVAENKAKNGYAMNLIYIKCPKYTPYKRDYVPEEVEMIQGAFYGVDGLKESEHKQGQDMTQIYRANLKRCYEAMQEGESYTMQELCKTLQMSNTSVYKYMQDLYEQGKVGFQIVGKNQKSYYRRNDNEESEESL